MFCFQTNHRFTRNRKFQNKNVEISNENTFAGVDIVEHAAKAEACYNFNVNFHCGRHVSRCFAGDSACVDEHARASNSHCQVSHCSTNDGLINRIVDDVDELGNGCSQVSYCFTDDLYCRGRESCGDARSSVSCCSAGKASDLSADDDSDDQVSCCFDDTASDEDVLTNSFCRDPRSLVSYCPADEVNNSVAENENVFISILVCGQVSHCFAGYKINVENVFTGTIDNETVCFSTALNAVEIFSVLRRPKTTRVTTRMQMDFELVTAAALQQLLADTHARMHMHTRTHMHDTHALDKIDSGAQGARVGLCPSVLSSRVLSLCWVLPFPMSCLSGCLFPFGFRLAPQDSPRDLQGSPGRTHGSPGLP